MKKGRIKAFTLIELVLAMMLAAIVIGMAYSAFTIFSRLYGSYHGKNLAHADVRTFKQVVHRDVKNAVRIEQQNSGIVFKDSLSMEQLAYSFGPDHLIRIKNAVPDTFKLKHLTVHTAFEGVAVSDGIIDRLTFRFDYDAAPMVVTAFKKYTATELFNYQDSLWKQ
ncbi:MAG TPA: type II secretion system protein [Pedobacter sp.]|nr:type II secretion system protein [Pedobacter sp.]